MRRIMEMEIPFNSWASPTVVKRLMTAREQADDKFNYEIVALDLNSHI